MRREPKRAVGGIAPGLGIAEERFIDRAGREVIVVFDQDSIVGLCDGLSVECDFDHCRVSFVVLWVGEWEMQREDNEGCL